MRKTVQQLMSGYALPVVGICGTNFGAAYPLLNQATRQLVLAATETGWWGGWAKAVFNVSRLTPYLTLPPQYARAVNMDVCHTPIRINNEWLETLFDGIGLQTIANSNNGCGPMAAYDRGNIPTAFDLPATNNYVRLYLTDVRDIGKRILFSSAYDQNGNGIYSSDGLNNVNGFYLTLNTPFVTSSFIVTSFAAIEKPVTYGDIVLRSVDATTGVETFLSRYTPRETAPAYRRYYLNSLPCGCCSCPVNPGFAQVTAMLKYEIPTLSQPSDFVLIANEDALAEEFHAIRLKRMETAAGVQMGMVHHQDAIKLLQKELQHYLGSDHPAIVVRPSGVIGLRQLQIGSMR